MDDLVKTIQLLNQNVDKQSTTTIRLNLDAIRNIPHTFLYDIEHFEHVVIELEFFNLTKQLRHIVKREIRDNVFTIDAFFNENKEQLVFEHEVEAIEFEELFNKLLNSSQPQLHLVLKVKFHLDKDEGQKIKAKNKKFQEERSFRYSLDISGLARQDAKHVHGCIDLNYISSEYLNVTTEDMLSVSFDINLSEAMITTQALETPPEFKSLKESIEPSFKIHSVIKRLIQKAKSLCPKLLNDYNAVIGSNSNYDDFKKFNAFTDQQKNNLLNTRKNNYLKEFFVTSKHNKIHASLLDIIDELVYDRVTKKMIDTNDKTSIENMLHKTQYKINRILEHTIQKYFAVYQDRVPFDILHANQYTQKEYKKQIAFFADTDEFFYMKLKEYEKIGYYHLAEKMLKERVLEETESGKTWHSLCMYYMRRQNFMLAEAAHWKVLNYEQPSVYQKTLSACFYLQRNHVKRAHKQLSMNLEEDKWSIIDNLLMSFVNEKYFNQPKLAVKYFNVAKRRNARNSESKTNKSQLKGVKQDQESSEDIWKELVLFLLKNFFVDIAEHVLGKFVNKKKFKQIIQGNIQSIRGNYEESNKILNEFLDENPGPKQEMDGYYSEALLTTAYNCYFLNNHYEAEILFLKYIEYTNSSNFYEVLLVLGYSYLKRNAFKEANMIFKKLIKMNKKSVIVWLGLAITGLKGDPEEKEFVIEALINALKLDHLNADIVANILLYFCHTDDGSNYYKRCLREMFKILKLKEVENLQILDEISIFFKGTGGVDMEEDVFSVIDNIKDNFRDYRVNLEWISKKQVLAESGLNII